MYLVLVVAPFYLNGIAGQPKTLIGVTDALDPKMFPPFSVPGGGILLGFAEGLALLGPLVLPTLCLLAIATLVWSEWPREAQRERRRELIIQLATVVAPTAMFFLRWREIIGWYMD